MNLDLHYTDPRLVDLYEADNPRGDDYDFWIQLAKDTAAKHIIDLGCGTGLLARELATHGWQVTAVDPASQMLAYGQKQPGVELVTWLEGDSSVLNTIPNPNADLALMTGNVSQVFLEDADWLTTLKHIHKALRPGGYVAFESRNPAAQAWESWQKDATYERCQTVHGELECWLELVDTDDIDAVNGGKVHFRAHNIFTATGETLVGDSVLRFRTAEQMRGALEQAGFTVKHMYGGWHGELLTGESRLMVFVAQRPS